MTFLVNDLPDSGGRIALQPERQLIWSSDFPMVASDKSHREGKELEGPSDYKSSKNSYSFTHHPAHNLI
ncbi:hypothetical protein [Maridesulfovibrio sp.]|uniref:hypothetical protein n=1 Tax=Maridesulfovibrio sp. TaxID=2795000 RepID=UPI0039EE0B91